MIWSRWNSPNRTRTKAKTRPVPSGSALRKEKDPPLAIEELRRRGSLMAAGLAGEGGQPLFAIPQAPPKRATVSAEKSRPPKRPRRSK
jgi:hypothetical protein